MVTPGGQRAGGRVLARRYHLQRVLGRGAMGAVWEAEDTFLRRTVAVKEVVLPGSLSPEERAVSCERTLREARAIARLGHPNVVTLFDVLDEDARPWVVMELVPSRSLAEVIKEDGPLHPLRVATVGLAILGALEAAHAAGITHRDVKPGNILLGHDGRVKLTDFGIARAAGDDTITGTGLLVGSPSYIAPEIVKGLEAGAPADLWGLGATLYAAVEGRAPFSGGDAMDTLSKVVQEPPAPYERAGPLVPALDAMLQKDPTRRARPVEARRALLDVLRGGNDAEPPRPARSAPAPSAAAVPVAEPLESLPPSPAPSPEPAAAGLGLADLLVPVWRQDRYDDSPPAPATRASAAGAAATTDNAVATGAAAAGTAGGTAGGTAAGTAAGTASGGTAGGPAAGAAGGPAAGTATPGDAADGDATAARPAGGTAAAALGAAAAAAGGLALHREPGPDREPVAGAGGQQTSTETADRTATAGAARADEETGGKTRADEAVGSRTRADEAAEVGGIGAGATVAGRAVDAQREVLLADDELAEPDSGTDLPDAGASEDHWEAGASDDRRAAGATAAVEQVETDSEATVTIPAGTPGRLGPAGTAGRLGPPASAAAFGSYGGRVDPDLRTQRIAPLPFGSPPVDQEPARAFRPQPPSSLDFEGERSRGDRRRRGLAALLAVAVLAVAVLAGGLLLVRSLRGGADDRAGGTSAPSASLGPATIPSGYTRYSGSGFTIGVPRGWPPEAKRDGVIDVRDPAASRFLRLITVDTTSPALEQLSAAEKQFAADPTYGSYHQVKLRTVEYRGLDAADWEFTFTLDGVARHVLYRGIVAEGRTYGIYLSAPEDMWSASTSVFQVAANTFRTT